MNVLQFITEPAADFPPHGLVFNTVRAGDKWSKLKRAEHVTLVKCGCGHRDLPCGVECSIIGRAQVIDVVRVQTTACLMQNNNHVLNNITNFGKLRTLSEGREYLEASLRAGYGASYDEVQVWTVITLMMDVDTRQAGGV